MNKNPDRCRHCGKKFEKGEEVVVDYQYDDHGELYCDKCGETLWSSCYERTELVAPGSYYLDCEEVNELYKRIDTVIRVYGIGKGFEVYIDDNDEAVLKSAIMCLLFKKEGEQ